MKIVKCDACERTNRLAYYPLSVGDEAIDLCETCANDARLAVADGAGQIVLSSAGARDLLVQAIVNTIHVNHHREQKP